MSLCVKRLRLFLLPIDSLFSCNYGSQLSTFIFIYMYLFDPLLWYVSYIRFRYLCTYRCDIVLLKLIAAHMYFIRSIVSWLFMCIMLFAEWSLDNTMYKWCILIMQNGINFKLFGANLNIEIWLNVLNIVIRNIYNMKTRWL